MPASQSTFNADSFFVRMLRLLLFAAGLGWCVLYILLPVDWHTQSLLALLTIFGAMLLGKLSRSTMMTMALMVLSGFATLRYAWWRITTSIAFFRDPANAWDWADAACICILLSAEVYAFLILFLGFMQTLWPLKRPPVPLPESSEEWPHVDLLIPTYNEPLNVVKYTAMAALNVDWPADKIHIYILDDGRRDAFREFAEEAGVGYMTRDDNAHAKAGNINRALRRLDSPFVAIFDCDHLPTRSFLQVTMGWFQREQRLAMVQTPHHFYSADPFERNLKQFRLIPNEGELFYGVVQDGNDFWNATFFCGSCAVLRRTALDEIGGIAVETVTEDAHTSLRMQMRGWNTAYINIPQAAGLATERLSGHIQQRVRWARGMIQILRTDNPLFAKGLKFAQRICYFNAMTHFLYAVPRLIFLTAPLIYLFFSRSNVPGYWAAILAYALPHLVLSNMTNSRIQGQHRHSFWNEIYETVLAPYILLPTLIALINPKLGTFNVTAKGGFVEETYFDGKIAIPFVVLLALNFAGLLTVIPRLTHISGLEWLWDGSHPGTVYMNALWCIFNIIILGVAITVAREEIQRREQVRIDFILPARVRFADGTIVSGTSVDVSIGGIALTIPKSKHTFNATLGEIVTLLLPMRVGDAELPCSIAGHEGEMLRLQFEALTLLEQEMLTTILYSRADAWLGWGENREPDRPLRSFYRILKLSIRGLWSTFAMAFVSRKPPTKPLTTATKRVTMAMILALSIGLASRALHAQSPSQTSTRSYRTSFTLKELGVMDTIALHGPEDYRSASFALPVDQIAEDASVHLIYRFSPQSASSGHLKVLLNGTAVATLDPTPGPDQELIEQTLPLPAELLVRNNQLSFEFTSRSPSRCNNAAADAMQVHIAMSSHLEISGQRLAIPADLSQLPLPILDPEVNRQRVIPMLLPSNPSTQALRAAGVVASYFGMVADYPIPRFPVSLVASSTTDLPQGNLVLVAENSSSLVTSLNIGSVSGPTVALRSNPADGSGTILIITAPDGPQLLLAAQAFASQSKQLQGVTEAIQDFDLPDPRVADDAPRWAREQKVPLWKTADSERSSDASEPLVLFLRVPPDLFYADRANLNLHLEYRHQSTNPAAKPSLVVRLNGTQAGEIKLAHKSNPSLPTKADLPLPVSSLRPFSNSLSTQWLIGQPANANCTIASPVNFQGSILQSSYLDLSGLPHWASLPNLELFSNAGFPFTRFADLSQTTIILPTQASPQEIETYLTLLAHFSAQTGYPALRVSVGTAADMHAGADSDLLIIGTAQDNPATTLTSDRMPVTIDGEHLLLNQPTDIGARIRAFWEQLRSFGTTQGPSFDLQQLPTALLESFESPYASNRTVVLLELNNPSVTDAFLDAFLNASHSSEISGDVSAFDGSVFRSFQVKTDTYSLGSRPWFTRLTVFLIEGPWLLVIGMFLFAILLATRMEAYMVRKSALRLHLEHTL